VVNGRVALWPPDLAGGPVDGRKASDEQIQDLLPAANSMN
jgi:hypothetical protein